MYSNYTCYDRFMNRYLPTNDDITIFEYKNSDGDLIRVYLHKDGWHSATYVNYEKRNELIFEYTKRFNVIFDMIPNLSKILMIGAAGYSYPKYVISHYPNVKMDVVDNDPNCESIARSQFFLDELYSQYHLDENHRLETYIQDGRDYIESCNKRYDIVINDAFYGMIPLIPLYTVEACEKIKGILNKDGLYVINTPGYSKLEESTFLLDTINTLLQVFHNVYLFPAFQPDTESYQANYIVIGTDGKYSPDGTIPFTLEDTIIFRDKDIVELVENYSY